MPRDEENLAVRLLIQLGTVDIKAFGCRSLFTEHATGALAVGAALANLVWWNHVVARVLITALNLVWGQETTELLLLLLALRHEGLTHLQVLRDQIVLQHCGLQYLIEPPIFSISIASPSSE